MVLGFDGFRPFDAILYLPQDRRNQTLGLECLRRTTLSIPYLWNGVPPFMLSLTHLLLEILLCKPM